MKITHYLFVLFVTFAAEIIHAQSVQHITAWKQVATQMPAEWYASAEAVDVAKNVLNTQSQWGGWPKNMVMHKPISQEAIDKIKANSTSSSYAPTIDNYATLLEMRFLAKIYNATQDVQYKDAFLRGLNYIFKAQYANGGWPQFYPLRKDYSKQITFNDNAIVNVMALLEDIFTQEPDFKFLSVECQRKAKLSFDKGIACILRTQIVRKGQPTIWAAQYDENTLLPANARAFELASYSVSESVSILYLLFSVKNPSPEIIRSVTGAIAWLERHKLQGIRQVIEQDGTPKGNKVIVKDAQAPALWARFYDLENEKPIFVGRDGVKKYDIAQIEAERRNGYSWYGTWPENILVKAYPNWKKRNRIHD